MSDANGDERWALPEGWEWTTLGEIREDGSLSINPAKQPEQYFELYSVPSYEKQLPEITCGTDIGSSKQTVIEDCVLLCKINPRINRVWVVGAHSEFPKIASTEWIVFGPVPQIKPQFLRYYMMMNSFRDHLAHNASGVGGSLMRVRPATLENYPFPLAPLPDQHRIVSEIEKQFTRLDAAVAALRRAKANLARYKAAVLQAAVSGRLVAQDAADEPAGVLLGRILAERRAQWEAANPKKQYVEPKGVEGAGLPGLPVGWVWARMEQIGQILGGLTQHHKRDAYPMQLPFLRVANVYANRLELDDIETIGILPSEVERVRLEKGDLLIVEGNGSIDQIGRVALWDGSIDNCLHQNHIIKVRLFDKEIAAYVLYWLLSKGGREQITLVASSTSGLYTLSLSKVASLAIPLPPLSEQVRITAEVDRRLSIYRATEVAIDAALARAERLRQGVLGRAFRGELVANGETSEVF